MKYVIIVLLALMSLFSASGNAEEREARKLIFAFDGGYIYPLAVLQQGQLIQTFFGDEARDQPFKEYFTGARYFLYNRGGLVDTAIVRDINLTFGDYGNPDRATVTLASKGKKNFERGIITNYRLTTKNGRAHRISTSLERVQLNQLLINLLSENKVKKAEISRLIKTCSYVATQVSADEEFVHLISCVHAENGLDRSLFLISTPTNNKPGAAFFNLSSIPLSDESHVAGTVSYDFVDHADLDGDGTDELLVQRFDQYLLFKRVGGIWKQVVAVSPGFINE